MSTTEAAIDAASVRRDAAWLVAGYAITAASGFPFWVLAAATLPRDQLGMDSALISLFSAAAALASCGPGSAVVVLLPTSGESAGRLVARAYLRTVALSLATGIPAGILASVVREGGAPSLPTISAVTVATVLWAVFNLQAQVLTGLGDTRSVMLSSSAANLVKLGIFPATAGLALTPHPLLVAMLLPALATTAVISGVRVPALLRKRALRRDAQSRHVIEVTPRAFARLATRDGLGIGIALGVSLSLSFLVTLLGTPAEGALFAICYQVAVVLELLTIGVATALAKNAATASDGVSTLAASLHLRVAAGVALAGVAATIGVPVLFTTMPNGYDPGVAAVTVGLLAAAAVARSSYELWAGLQRARRRVGLVLVANTIAAVFSLIVVFAFVPTFGPIGAAAGVFVAGLFQGVVGVVGLNLVTPRIRKGTAR